MDFDENWWPKVIWVNDREFIFEFPKIKITWLYFLSNTKEKKQEKLAMCHDAAQFDVLNYIVILEHKLESYSKSSDYSLSAVTEAEDAVIFLNESIFKTADIDVNTHVT